MPTGWSILENFPHSRGEGRCILLLSMEQSMYVDEASLAYCVIQSLGTSDNSLSSGSVAETDIAGPTVTIDVFLLSFPPLSVTCVEA